MIARSATVSMPAEDARNMLGTVAGEAALRTFWTSTGLLSRGWAWIQERKAARSSSRRLRVIETVSLGDRRFVAVVQVDKLQFLIGGGPATVALLAELDVAEVSSDVLEKASAVGEKQPTSAEEHTGVGA